MNHYLEICFILMTLAGMANFSGQTAVDTDIEDFDLDQLDGPVA